MIDHTTFWLKATYIITTFCPPVKVKVKVKATYITFCPAVLMGGSGFPISTSFTRSRLIVSSLSASAGDDDDDDGEAEK